MNISDFNKEFDLEYNNAMSFSAPPINVYMKSLFLTQAQEDLVLELNETYDSDEKVREQLRNILVNSVIAYDASLNATLAASKFNTDSKLFEVSTNVWFVKGEFINDGIQVIPVPLDEYKSNINNPFKKPTLDKAWKIELGTTAYNIREIIYPGTITTYTIRYLKKPDPIILESLTPYGMTIEDISAQTSCKLSSETHRAIVKRAVDKAVLAYKENSLQARLQAGGRDK